MAQTKRRVQRPEIVGIAGDFAKKTFTFATELFIVGRDEEQCEFVILGPCISRRQCSIQFDKTVNMYKVTDYSMNGTFVDERRRLLSGITQLVPRGTVLSLGTAENKIWLR